MPYWNRLNNFTIQNFLTCFKHTTFLFGRMGSGFHWLNSDHILASLLMTESSGAPLLWTHYLKADVYWQYYADPAG